MDARRWDQFLSFLDRARSKPAFEAEERTGEPDETMLIYLDQLEEALAVRSGST